jgi:hypothetical protein
MWQAIRLSGNTGLAERASKKLRNDELLVLNFAASRLRMELDRVPLRPMVSRGGLISFASN